MYMCMYKKIEGLKYMYTILYSLTKLVNDDSESFLWQIANPSPFMLCVKILNFKLLGFR